MEREAHLKQNPLLVGFLFLSKEVGYNLIDFKTQ
jgi:hypothetical protein